MSNLKTSKPKTSKKKEKPSIRFRVEIDGVLYDDPPDWFKDKVGKLFSNVLYG